MKQSPDHPLGIITTRTTRGAGRWAYCKYCYKNVQPVILIEESRIERQRLLCCSECGSGLEVLERTR